MKKTKTSKAAKAWKKVKKYTIAAHKRKLWLLFSKYVRERDNYTCFTCGTRAMGGMMHAGHFITRNVSATLYDPRNVHAQCATCNIYLRGNVGVYASRLEQKYGAPEFLALVERGKKTKQWTAGELLTLISTLKDSPENYEAEYFNLTSKNS